MNAPADPSSEDSSAGRIEAMLAGFKTAAPAPPVTAAAPAPAAQRRPQDDAVRPLWQAEGGRAAAPRSPWWQARPVWALVGLLVGIAGSQGWQALRQQEQRDLALASISLQQQVLLPPATALRASEPAPSTAVRPAALPAAAQTQATAIQPPAKPTSIVADAPLEPALVTVAPVAPAPAALAKAPAAPAAKRPAKPDSPAARCKQVKAAEFQRCLQVQCRKDRYFAHRQCIALYESNAKP